MDIRRAYVGNVVEIDRSQAVGVILRVFPGPAKMVVRVAFYFEETDSGGLEWVRLYDFSFDPEKRHWMAPDA